MRNSTILAIITTATLTAAHGGIEGAHIYVPAAARAGRHRRLARRQPSRLSTDLASSTAIENSLPTAKPASVYVAPLAYANAAVPTALALQQDASSSNIFVSSNRYFGAAIACIAVISFLGTLALIAVIRCCVNRCSSQAEDEDQAPLCSISPAKLADCSPRSSIVGNSVQAKHVSPTFIVNGHLAPPPSYTMRSAPKRTARSHKPPSPPLPVARPPYVDGPPPAFSQPRPAPPPPGLSVVPTQPSPLRTQPNTPSEVGAQPPRDRLAGLGRPPRQDRVDALGERRGYERRST